MSARRAAIAMLLALLASSPATGFELSVEGRIKGQVERLGFSHDASASNPVLGTPTSILEFAPANSLWAELALSGRSVTNTGLWFDLAAAIPLTGGGQFDDFDYYTGQVLFSHTLSGVSIGQGIVGTIRLPVPFVGEIAGRNATLRPYLAGSLESRQLTAIGLRCGTVCGGIPPVASTTPVIGYDLAGWQVGAGLWLETKLSDTQTLDIRTELLGGSLSANDTHFLRTDFGPAPHVSYDLTTVAAQAEVSYTQALTEDLALSASALAGLRNGAGTATFGASLPTPIGLFDADFWQVSGTIALGLKASLP